MRCFKLAFLLVLLLKSHFSFASGIIDAEISDIIGQIASPIFRAAKLTNPKIIILNDPSPNAFTSGGDTIYINSGLITQFPEADILRGVIAHEVGHIVSRHVALAQGEIAQAKKLAATSLILGAIGSGITGNPAGVVHGAILGNHIAERSVLNFSRENEIAADLKAMEYLKKIGYSANGLLKLLEYFRTKQYNLDVNRYELTHPLSSERIEILKNHQKNTKPIDDTKLNILYKLASAKLLAFTSDKPNISNLSEDAKKYAASILSLKKSDKISALASINSLIQKYPNNPYFLEHKAQILTYFGDMKALEYFKAASSHTNNRILKIEESIAKIILSNDKAIIRDSVSNLAINLAVMDNNITIINYLSLGYGKLSDTAHSIYYRALKEKLLGNNILARKLALSAAQISGINRELRTKIEDLIQTNE